MAEMIEQKLLQLLKEEFKSMELEFNKIFDRALENFRKARKDPEGSANQIVEKKVDEEILTTKHEVFREKGNIEKSAEEYSVTESEELPDEKNTESPEVAEVEKSTIKAAERPIKEASRDCQVIFDPKIVLNQPSKPIPKPKPNTPPNTHLNLNPSSQTINLNTEATPNLPSLNYPNAKIPANQIRYTQAINQNTADNEYSKRLKPWPNKPSINTNPNRPNPWPNKLPTLTYFIRPKPWPGDHPICTVPKPRTGSNETKKFGKQTRRRSYQFQPRVRTKSDGQLSIFPVTNHARQRNQHRFWSTHSRADAIELLIAIHRTSLTAATTTTSFPDVNQLRSRPESQLMVLPVFDPGDFHSKKVEGKVLFHFNGDFGHFGRILERNRRRIVVSSRRFSEKRKIGNPRKGIENQRKPKKIWGLIFRDFGLVKKKKLGFMRRFGRLGLKENDLGISGVSSEKRCEKGKGWFYTIRYNPNGCVLGNWNPGSNGGLVCVLEYHIPWSKLVSNTVWANQILDQLGYYYNCQFLQRCWAFWRPDQLLHMRVINSVGLFSNWDNSRLGPLGATITIGFPFQVP